MESLIGSRVSWVDDSQIDILSVSRDDIVKGGLVKMIVREI